MMVSRTLICFVLCSIACGVLGELPVTVTVGHRDGGVVGFRAGQSIHFFFHTTPTGAFAVNYGQRETIVEWTVPKNPTSVGTFPPFLSHFIEETSSIDPMSIHFSSPPLSL